MNRSDTKHGRSGGPSPSPTSQESLSRQPSTTVPYFSKQSVRSLQPLIDRSMGILLARLRQFADSGLPLKLDDAYAALANGETSS